MQFTHFNKIICHLEYLMFWFYFACYKMSDVVTEDTNCQEIIAGEGWDVGGGGLWGKA